MTYGFFEYMEFWQVFVTVGVICLVAAALLHAAIHWLKRHTHLRWVQFFVRSDIQELPTEEKQDEERSA